MTNETLWLIFLACDLVILLTLFRLFGKAGLYAAIVYSIILCNIQVLKTVELFGFVATLGNILYGSVFLATDILGELYGKKAARRGVWLGFIALFVTTLYMQFAIRFQPDASDFAHPHLEALFSWMPRIALASGVAYGVSQFHDVWAYHYWRKKTRGRHLWLRNNLSTLVSQALDTVIFTAIAFWGAKDFKTLWEIFLTAYVIKAIVALCDTPFLYLARAIAPRRPEEELPGAARKQTVEAPAAAPTERRRATRRSAPPTGESGGPT